MKMQINTLRGLACLLLVCWHVVGSDPDHGLQIADGALRQGNDALACLRMPLFACVAGLVYGLRPFYGNGRAFLADKARRLLLPMLVVGTLYAVLQSWVPGTNFMVRNWYLLHLQPVGHFWFVESLFGVFVVTRALEHWQVLASGGRFCGVLLSACALYLLVVGWPWLGIEGAIYLFPYFLLGMAYSRFPLATLLSNVWGRLILLAVAAAIMVHMGMSPPTTDRRTPEMLALGASLSLLLLGLRVTVPWLANIGHHSYAIYLWHVFFTAAIRIALHRTGIDDLAVGLLAGICGGLLGPILLERVLARFKWTALLLLGQSVTNPPAPAR